MRKLHQWQVVDYEFYLGNVITLEGGARDKVSIMNEKETQKMRKVILGSSIALHSVLITYTSCIVLDSSLINWWSQYVAFKITSHLVNFNWIRRMCLIKANAIWHLISAQWQYDGPCTISTTIIYLSSAVSCMSSVCLPCWRCERVSQAVCPFMSSLLAALRQGRVQDKLFCCEILFKEMHQVYIKQYGMWNCMLPCGSSDT